MSIHLLRSGLMFPAPSGAGWELVGTPVTGLQDNGANITISKPSGLTTGDKWIVCLAAYGGHAAVVPGSPWVQHATTNNATTRPYVLSRDVDGTEGSSIAVTRSGGGWSYWTYISFGIRGVDQDGAANGVSTVSGATTRATPVITAAAGSAILSFYQLQNNDAITAPSGVTVISNYQPTSRFSILACIETQAGAGSTTARTASVASARDWSAIAVEFPLS